MFHGITNILVIFTGILLCVNAYYHHREHRCHENPFIEGIDDMIKAYVKGGLDALAAILGSKRRTNDPRIIYVNDPVPIPCPMPYPEPGGIPGPVPIVPCAVEPCQ